MIASTCSCVAPIAVFIDCARRVSFALASLNSADREPKALSIPRMRVSIPRKASAAWFKDKSLSLSSCASEIVLPSTFFRFSASFARIWKVLTSPSSLKVIVAVEFPAMVYLFIYLLICLFARFLYISCTKKRKSYAWNSIINAVIHIIRDNHNQCCLLGAYYLRHHIFSTFP